MRTGICNVTLILNLLIRFSSPLLTCYFIKIVGWSCFESQSSGVAHDFPNNVVPVQLYYSG